MSSVRSSRCLGIAVAALLAGSSALATPPTVLPPSTGAPSPVRRVVSLTPSLTDAVAALGAVDTLVGVTRFDDDPALASVPRVGGYADVSVERVVSLRPDLVLAQRHGANARALAALSARGIAVAVFELDTVHDVVSALLDVARLLGRAGEGAALARSIARARALWRGRTEGLSNGRSPRVLVALGLSPLVVAGPDSFIGELLGDCGASNVVPRAPAPTAYPIFSAERLVTSRIDVVVDAAEPGDPGASLRRLEPLAGARWVTWSQPRLLRPGPSIPAALDALCEAVHRGIPVRADAELAGAQQSLLPSRHPP